VTKGTDKDPEIDFDSGTGNLLIKGNCLSKNPKIFYEGINNWLEIHLPAFPDPIQFDIEPKTLNSLSLVEIARLVKLVERVALNGKNAKVVWHCSENDPEMRERGQMLNQMTQLDVAIDK